MVERAPYPWFMIMILIVSVRSQTIFLIIGRVARYALVRVYGLHLGAEALLFYRRARLFRADSHSERVCYVVCLSPTAALSLFQMIGYEGVETVGLPNSLCGVVGKEAWKPIQQQHADN